MTELDAPAKPHASPETPRQGKSRKTMRRLSRLDSPPNLAASIENPSEHAEHWRQPITRGGHYYQASFAGFFNKKHVDKPEYL